MEQLTALKKLADNVEAGTLDRLHLSGNYAKRGLSTYSAISDSEEREHALAAYDGSLDGAKKLHDSFLGKMSQYSIVTDPTCGYIVVTFWPKGLSNNAEYSGKEWFDDNPSRAWLLAIIRAKISMIETK